MTNNPNNNTNISSQSSQQSSLIPHSLIRVECLTVFMFSRNNMNEWSNGRRMTSDRRAPWAACDEPSEGRAFPTQDPYICAVAFQNYTQWLTGVK